jgi:hypothetical protein
MTELPERRSVILLAGPGDSTWIVANALRESGFLEAVILESPPSKVGLIRRRVSRLGLTTVIGQLAFLPLAAIMRLTSADRITEICRGAGLHRDIPRDISIARVPSVDTPAVIDMIRQHSPSLIVVNGTRIISRSTLEKIDVPLINIHAGITPMYRGVHGGYWALAQGDAENFGVTIHLVDPGIDTGNILAQVRTTVGPTDNFATYPYLQLAAGVPKLLSIIESYDGRGSDGKGSQLPSKLWSHPTLLKYLKQRLHGVR